MQKRARSPRGARKGSVPLGASRGPVDKNPRMEGKGVVLVTGGSGFLGGWCIVSLLEAGYSVRTTVRNLARESEVRGGVASATEPGGRLEVVTADLLKDDGSPDAV